MYGIERRKKEKEVKDENDAKVDINRKFVNKSEILKEIEKSIQHQNILFGEKVSIKVSFVLKTD